MPPPSQHQCIKASAGSGKTYALTNRYIQLLTAGADPAKIIALTFTRKASNEFLDTILKKLGDAASDEDSAQSGVHIDDERASLGRRNRGAHVDRSRRFTDPALLIGDSNNTRHV